MPPPGILHDALDEVLALLLPTECAGCGALDWTLCPSCRDALVAAPRRHDLDGLAAWSGRAFDGVAARTMRALKSEGRTALARDLGPLLGAAVARLDPGDAVLVPVPTSRAAMRRRGYRVTDLLARRAGLAVRPLLRAARGTADQRGLGVEARADNVAGSLRARAARGLRVIVLDDVLTTGATLGEARRALEEAGAEVLGAAVALATPLRRAVGDAHGSLT